jgi:putative ABC transport system permease protein
MAMQMTLDLRYSVRLLRRSPGYSAAVVLTLALGIGAAASIFSVVYGVLLRPLPYRTPEQLALVVMERSIEGARQPVPLTFPLSDLSEWEARTHAFESMAFYSTESSGVLHDGITEMLDTARVSDAFFATVGGRFVQGRGLDAADRQTSIVISSRLNRRLFGEAASGPGRHLTVGQRSYEVIGVVDPTFQFPNPRTDIWLPADERCCPYASIARLKAGVGLPEAETDLEAMVASLAQSNPRVYAGAAGSVATVRDQVVGESQRALWILMAAVGLVLVVVCANVSNLLVARNLARARELAVRIALGATRRRLVAQSLAETVVLVAMGGTLGILIALGVVRVLERIAPAALPRLDAVRVDLPVLAFALAVIAATTIAVGLLPAVRFRDAAQALQRAAAGRTAGPIGRPIRYGLVITELAVSMMLLVGAGLLGRSLVKLMTTDIGVQTDRVVTASLNLTFGRRLSDLQQLALVDRILTRIRALPHVEDAGIGGSVPPNAGNLRVTLKRFADTVDYQATAVPATPGYFSTLGMRLSRGRFFTDADQRDRPDVVIMTEDTARRFFGDGDPIGRTLSLPLLRDGRNSSAEMTLVGIVGNVKHAGLDRPPDDAVYRPLSQQTWPTLALVAKAKDDPAALAPILRSEIAAVDPGVVVSSVTTVDALVSDAAAQPRFRAALLGALAVLTLSIASVGLYGVVCYTVSQRTGEFGVRMALGADRTDLLTLVLRDAAVIAAIGLTLGTIGALATTRVLASLLFGIEPTDPASFVYASLLMLLVAFGASYLPARRASRMDPSVALRTE